MPTNCSEIIMSEPVYHEAGSPVDALAKTMATHNCRHVLVVANAGNMHLVGSVSMNDIISKIVALGRDPRATPVQEIMTPDPACCTRDQDIRHALNLMQKCQLSSLPIVDKQHRLIGVIAFADMQAHLPEPLPGDQSMSPGEQAVRAEESDKDKNEKNDNAVSRAIEEARPPANIAPGLNSPCAGF